MNESFCASENNSRSHSYSESNIQIVVKDDVGDDDGDNFKTCLRSTHKAIESGGMTVAYVGDASNKTRTPSLPTSSSSSSSPSSESMGQSFCVDIPIPLEPLTINQETIYKNQLFLERPLLPKQSDTAPSNDGASGNTIDNTLIRQVIGKQSSSLHAKKHLFNSLNAKNNRISCMNRLHVPNNNQQFYLGANSLT